MRSVLTVSTQFKITHSTPKSKEALMMRVQLREIQRESDSKLNTNLI